MRNARSPHSAGRCRRLRPRWRRRRSPQFFLQAGSFRKQVEADKVRAQIILLGQDVRVERVTVREEPWFRVLVGPFTTREQLNLAQKTLAGSGYKNLLLQQRQVR